jgi:hypothetical protein
LQVTRNPTSRFKRIENCNYCIELGQRLSFTLVNIAGLDIVDGARRPSACVCDCGQRPFWPPAGSKKLLLAFVWWGSALVGRSRCGTRS